MPDAQAFPSAVLGVVEDERMRATVTVAPDRSHVWIDGSVDAETAPVVKELIDALHRWHRRRSRRDRRRGRPLDRRLVIDVRSAAPWDPAGWRLLAEQRDRWRRTRGPCDLRVHPGPEPR
jgi:hypothetical protein